MSIENEPATSPIKPITPTEVASAKSSKIPDEVIKAFNDLIVAEWDGHSAVIHQDEICTFAVVKDGRWFERGKMGWFAAVHDEKDPETWASVWDSLVRNVSPDTLITIVDCHI